MSSEHTPSTPTPAPKAEPKAAGQTRGRLRRRVLIGLGIVSMVVVGAYLVLGRSPLTTRMVLAQLNRVQGAQVTLDHAHLGLDGALHLRGLTVTANASSDLPIQAAELLRVDRATIDLSPSGMVGSGDLVRSITLDGALARLSVDPDAGRVNSAGLAVVSGGPGGGLPVVRIRSGAIEFGEHGAGGYTVLRTVPMRAEFRPEPVPDVSAPGTPTSLAAAFSLTQTGMMLDGAGNEAPIDKPLDLTGRIDASGVNVTLSGVTLDDWPGAVPERYRRIVDLLHPEGDLRPSTLHVDPDGTISCVVRLDGVAIDLPVDTRGAIIDHGPRLRLTETYGPITITSDGYRADLRGQIDTLSYAVNLRSRGYGMDSAFNATLETTFRLDRGFGLLPFAPELVKEKLAMFGYPTGNVDRAIVHINRVAGAEPGDVEVNGELHLSDTTIRYRGFPYEVSGITGLITFTRHDMRVVRLDGRAPSGAVVHATAEFAPLGDSAEADIRVRAENVPLDDTLRDALSTDRVAMLDALFDAAEHDRLVEEGLVLPPEVRNELSNKAASLRSRIGLATPEDERRLDVLRDELAQIEKRLAAPVFAFGAKAEIDVVLHRMYGEESIWTKQIDVRLPQAGLVPSRFPLPIAARDVRIRITDDDAKLVGGSFRGLRGGGADVEASFGLSEPGDDETTPLRIAIDAWDMPIDERLLHAIPRYRLDEGERADRPGTLRDLLDRLRPSGLVSCHATIQSNGVGPLDYEVCASLDGLSASPIPFGHTSSDTSAPLDLAINTGSIEVTPERVVLRVDAEAMCHTRAPGVISELALQTSLTLGDTPSVLAVEASARGLDARLPVEHAIAVFDRDLARRYLDARDRYRPSGTVDIDAELHGPLGDAFAAVVDLRPTGETGFNHDAGRITLSEPRGSVQIVAGAEPAVGFDDFSAWISVDNVQAGLLTADGELPLARGGSDRELDAARSLALSVDHARFESAFTRRIATERLGEAAATLLDRYDPAGAFGVQLSLRAAGVPDDLPEGEIGLPKLAVAGALEPSALRVHTTAGPVGFRAMSGTVEFSPSEVTFTGVTGRAENWSFAADGVWRQQGDGSVLDADLSLDADGIPDQLFALLPQAVREATRAIELNVHGNTTARDVAVHVTRQAGMPDVFDVAGTILVTDADARLGLPITEMDAALDFRAKSAAQPNADGPLTLGFRATRLRALGLRMSNVTAAVRRGETPGSLVVPELTGDCHGGRLVGSVRLGSAPTGALEERPWDGTPYWADIRLAGVRAAPFIADLRASAIESTKPVQNMAVFATTPLPGGVNAGSTLAVWSEAADHSRGVLDASLTLSGDTGSSASRLGTGEVRVAGGPLVTMPLVFTLIELSNLTLPVGDRLDTALAQFSIDGDRVVFEQLSARSSTVELFGYGTMDWPTKELDLRLHSRAVNGIPLISDIIENIRDEIVTARITGPLGDVKVKTEQFSAARRVLTALLGGGAGEADRRLREMERAARQSAGDTRLDARRAASRAAAEPVRGTVIEEGG